MSFGLHILAEAHPWTHTYTQYVNKCNEIFLKKLLTIPCNLSSRTQQHFQRNLMKIHPAERIFSVFTKLQCKVFVQGLKTHPFPISTPRTGTRLFSGQVAWSSESDILTAQTYFPAVTNISSWHREKITLVALPTLRPAAGLPQMASLLATLQTTTLPNKKGRHQQGKSDFPSEQLS